MAERDPSYEEFVLKFLERFFWIAAAMDPIGDNPDEMWDEEEGFFYDVLRFPDGRGERLKVRSLVGLLPLCATTAMPAELLDAFPHLRDRVVEYLRRNQDLLASIADPTVPGRERPAPAVARQRGQAAPHPDPDARRGALPRAPRHPLDLALAPRPPVRAAHRRSRVPGRLRAGGVDDRQPSAATPTGGGRSGSRPTCSSSGRCCSTTSTTATPSPSSARPARASMMTLFEVAQGALPPADLHLPARRRRPAPGLRRDRDLPDRPALAGPPALLRVLPRRQRRRPGRLAPDGLDRTRGPADPAVLEPHAGGGARRGPPPALASLPTAHRSADRRRRHSERVTRSTTMRAKRTPQPTRAHRVQCSTLRARVAAVSTFRALADSGVD